MYTRLTEYLIQGDTDNGINAFVIKGQENCFCSGNGIADFLQHSHLASEHPAFKFLLTLLDLKKPLIAAVTGAAIGIGTTILLHFDLVYASDTAKFKLPFIDLALVPEAGSSILLPRLVGHPKAAELLFISESFDANSALDMGLINKILPSNNLFEYALGRATKLAQQPPEALQATKKLLNYDRDIVKQQIHKELKEFAIRLQSDEAKSRFQTFLNR